MGAGAIGRRLSRTSSGGRARRGQLCRVRVLGRSQLALFRNGRATPTRFATET